MTVDIAEQSAYAPILPNKLNLTEQSAYIVIIPGTRVTVHEQSVFVVMFPQSAVRKRRIIMTMTG